MGLDPITAGLELITTTVNKIWPDKSEQEKMEITNAFALMQGQMQINQVEAASTSVWVSGWRPGFGWVGVVALFWQFILKPIIVTMLTILGHPVPALPGIDGTLWELMFGLLGMGALRSFDKSKGTS